MNDHDTSVHGGRAAVGAWRRRRGGQSLVENALIMGLVTIVAIVALSNIGNMIHNSATEPFATDTNGMTIGTPAANPGMLDNVNTSVADAVNRSVRP